MLTFEVVSKRQANQNSHFDFFPFSFSFPWNGQKKQRQKCITNNVKKTDRLAYPSPIYHISIFYFPHTHTHVRRSSEHKIMENGLRGLHESGLVHRPPLLRVNFAQIFIIVCFIKTNKMLLATATGVVASIPWQWFNATSQPSIALD